VISDEKERFLLLLITYHLCSYLLLFPVTCHDLAVTQTKQQLSPLKVSRYNTLISRACGGAATEFVTDLG
jgi:hypothetical protein